MRAEGLRGRIDWVLVGAIFGLVLIGSVAILSAAEPLPHYSQILQRHFLALGIGTVLFVFGLGFNYQIFQDQSKMLYAITIAVMICVLVFGVEQRGTRGWLQFRYFSFQPSELARLGTLLVLANVLDRRAKGAHSVKYVLVAFAVVFPVMALILREPDFSSTLIFIPMLFGMLFCGGANIAHLLAMGIYGAVALTMPLLWTLLSLRPEWVADSALLGFFMRLRDFDMPLLLAVLGIFLAMYGLWWLSAQLRFRAPAPYFGVAACILAAGLASGTLLDHQLKGYQRNRFVAFLVPEVDPRGAAYNVQQAQISIGSGGLWGKGVFSGTQSQLGFLPERHTDFIYAVIGEEMGFLGTMSVLVLYMLLLWRIVNAARLARDRYGYLVCCGLTAISAFYLIINMGMCIGLVPVAGIPLPLVSYGGSNLAVTLFAMGIVANIYSKRYAFY
ncbi:rod shape-determining protein RodA [Elusimicrobiota bacterium]